MTPATRERPGAVADHEWSVIDVAQSTPEERRARHAAYMRQWRARRIEQGLPSEQRSPEGIARRTAGMAAYTREYRARRREADPTWRPAKPKRTPEAHRAGEAVRRAIRKGTLVRPNTCEWCSATDIAIEAAHHNYVERLRVVWLCRPCHRRWDRESPKACRP